jgi:hypothetical protein
MEGQKFSPMADEDPGYLSWLRQQHCASCQTPFQIHPHHSTNGSHDPRDCVLCVGEPVTRPSSPKALRGARRGKGERAHDHDAFPLCFKCHRHFHDAAGPFREMDKAARRAWQDAQVGEFRSAYARVF